MGDGQTPALSPLGAALLPQPLGVLDDDAVAVLVQDALAGQAVERRGRVLAGAADQIGQLLVGDLKVDLGALVGLLPVLADQAQQLAREPGGDVLEDQVLELVLDFAGAPAEQRDELQGEPGALFQEVEKARAVDRVDAAFLEGLRHQLAALLADQGHLAEDLALAQDVQRQLAARLVQVGQLDLARLDEVDRVVKVASLIDDLALGVALGREGLAQAAELFLQAAALPEPFVHGTEPFPQIRLSILHTRS